MNGRPESAEGSMQFAPRRVEAARFRLLGPRLPEVQRAIRIGNLLRLALMSLASDSPPEILTGKNSDGDPLRRGHAHSFFLPEDADGDGLVDHLVFTVPESAPNEVVMALTSLRTLYTKMDFEGLPRQSRRRMGNEEWQVDLECMGTMEEVGQITPLLSTSDAWVSCTPYFHPWFRKRHGKFGPVDQIRHEAISRNLPPVIETKVIFSVWERLQNGVRGGNAETLGLPTGFDIHRGPRSDRTTIPDEYGRYVSLKFGKPIRGPVAFGYGCHYGLGLFVPQGAT